MSTIIVIRVFFVILSAVVGYYVGSLFSHVSVNWSLVGAAVGFISSAIVILTERSMRRISTRNLSAAVFGLLFGIFMAGIMSGILKLIPMDANTYVALQMGMLLVFCYLGMTIAIRGKDEFNIIIPYVKFARQGRKDEIILLDTSVIIDGRVADICKTKFLEGRLVVPRFVLRELQQVADSQDTLKRNRGRRGLDMLNKIQRQANVDVKIHEEDFPELSGVDTKLVKLAKLLEAKVFTNDYNLNKIAELQGVDVLNINDLANALKPVVLPGELMEVKIAKEGKEYNQGVAYLDDGTMIVVDNARHLVGQTVRVVATSVLQTSAGRMIFARLEPSNARPNKNNR